MSNPIHFYPNRSLTPVPPHTLVLFSPSLPKYLSHQCVSWGCVTILHFTPEAQGPWNGEEGCKDHWTCCPRVSPARAANATRVTGTSPRPPGLQTSDSTPGHSFQWEILLPIFLSLFQAQHIRCRYLGTTGTLTHFSPWMEVQSGGADSRPGRNTQFAAAPCTSLLPRHSLLCGMTFYTGRSQRTHILLNSHPAFPVPINASSIPTCSPCSPVGSHRVFLLTCFTTRSSFKPRYSCSGLTSWFHCLLVPKLGWKAADQGFHQLKLQLNVKQK